MKIVVGLGNPGKEYAKTRHNIGFMVLERIKRDLSMPVERSRFRSLLTEGTLNGEKIVLVAPQTFMNLSGHAVRETRNWFHADISDVIVVLDDMDIPFGTLRLRGSGSAGGHNGLRSIIEQLGTSEIARMRVGIGRPRSEAVSHVLSRFSPDEEAALPDLIERAAVAVLQWARTGLIATMNEVNRSA
jgi:PTH1 family peptidyl-tRNA hydrolase